MLITQVGPLLNAIFPEVLGESAVLAEDLSNLVDLGKPITELESYRNKFVTALVDRIGKTIYVDRPYGGDFPSLYMDSWQYGSIMAKFQTELKTANVNQSWELTDGTTYDQDTYYGLTASAKFFNKMTTHEVRQSLPDYQLNSAFSSSAEAAKFFSMISTHVENTLTLQNSILAHRCVTRLMAEILANGNTAQKVNLLSEYNTASGTSLTAAEALKTAEFIRYAVRRIKQISTYITKYSTIFNAGDKQRFTPVDRQRIFYLADFASALGIYLYNAPNQYATDFLQLPKGDTVPYWQGSGTGFDFASLSSINLTDGTVSANQSGIIAMLADEYALGICNEKARTTTHYNAAAEFTNYWHKRDARYFNDPDENAVLFYLA